MPTTPEFVSRGGLKLHHALQTFAISPAGKTCADLGCSTGGFVDCLLQNGAVRVYAVDTGYGVLEWKLRSDSRVITLERTNAMHVQLPEAVRLVTIDVAWTRQRFILPAAARLFGKSEIAQVPNDSAIGADSATGDIISLVKPHYEADKSWLRKGVLPAERLDEVIAMVRAECEALGFAWLAQTMSPILGSGGNAELLAHLRPPKQVP